MGLAALLLAEGHQVVFHARGQNRASAVKEFAGSGANVVVGELSSGDETRSVADQVNALGQMDAIIHNAGVSRCANAGARPKVMPPRSRSIHSHHTFLPRLSSAPRVSSS